MALGSLSKRADFSQYPPDICVITFSSDHENDHFDVIKKCLTSIIEHTDPNKLRLHIGCNNLSPRAMSFVDSLVETHDAIKYIGDPYLDAKGIKCYPKYPLQRKIFQATKNDWAIWFDDDIYVTENDWLETLEVTINSNPAVSQFGHLVSICLPLTVKETWIDPASWSKPDKVQYADMPGGRKIVSPFVLGGFYAINRQVIKDCNIPDERLFHNFGDWTTGMALCHNGFKLGNFTYGHVFGEAPRRGIHGDLAISQDQEVVLMVSEENGRKTFQWNATE